MFSFVGDLIMVEEAVESSSYDVAKHKTGGFILLILASVKDLAWYLTTPIITTAIMQVLDLCQIAWCHCSQEGMHKH
jgi:hypothetical protein